MLLGREGRCLKGQSAEGVTLAKQRAEAPTPSPSRWHWKAKPQNAHDLLTVQGQRRGFCSRLSHRSSRGRKGQACACGTVGSSWVTGRKQNLFDSCLSYQDNCFKSIKGEDRVKRNQHSTNVPAGRKEVGLGSAAPQQSGL